MPGLMGQSIACTKYGVTVQRLWWMNGIEMCVGLALELEDGISDAAWEEGRR